MQKRGSRVAKGDDDLFIFFEELRGKVEGEVEKLSTKVTSLGNQRDEDLGKLTEFSGQLTETRGQLAEVLELLNLREPAFLLSPWWWPAMKRSEAEEAWKLLTEFVDGLLIPRYDDGEVTATPRGVAAINPEAVPLPTSPRVKRCWFAHPGIVDKLSALFWARKGDYRRNAPANGPLEWQENWLPKTLDALDAEFNKKKCVGACPHLTGAIAGEWPEQKHGTLTLHDRNTWIKADVDARPEA
jgi:hypothetical protein